MLQRAEAGAARAMLWLMLRLPYRTRVRFAGQIFSRVIAPLAGWRKRIADNIDIAWPELEPEARRRLIREVPDNVGRMLIECWSGREFVERVTPTPFEGPGLAAFETAREAGRAVILVTAHFGNYDALRATLVRRGHDVGGLYKPMTNAGFNTVYVERISEIGSRLYPTSGRGITGLLRYLADGGVAGIVADVASRNAPVLRFFGAPAHTPLSAAEWAVKYDALLLPVFAIRQPDGISFRLRFMEPIAHGAPAEMMQSLNDVTEELVRQHPGQWFWIHRRWKGKGRGRNARVPQKDRAAPGS